jgi:hypothetical protein
MQKYLAFVAILIAALSFSNLADARNTPCSGKKGGVARCTADGKFLCQDGSISKSKRLCTRK